MSEFTEGKWIYDDETNYIFDHNKQMPIAQMRGWEYLTQELGLSFDEAYEVHQANARLIATSPEMYEMIQRLVDGIRTAEVLNGRLQVVRVNPVLVKSATQLLARIDGKEEQE